MSKLLLGIILVAALAFLAFMLVITVIALSSRKPGQSFADAERAAVRSGWRGLKSRFSPLREKEPFEDMAKPKPEAKYYSTYSPAPVEDLSSFNRPGHPVVFPGAATTAIPVNDINAAGTAYEEFAAEALAEDLDAMAGQHRFGDVQLPAPPITDDQFRYTGDFEIKRGDPLLSSPMTKTDIGFSNRGIGLFNA